MVPLAVEHGFYFLAFAHAIPSAWLVFPLLHLTLPTHLICGGPVKPPLLQ